MRKLALAVDRNGRLDLLSPIRQYAADNCRPEGADAEWPAHFLGLTQRLGETIGSLDDNGAVARLEPELPNIEAAIRAALSADRRLSAMFALRGLAMLTFVASLSAPSLGELAAASRATGDVLGEAMCIKALGDIALARSDHEGARKACGEALPLYRKVGDVLGEANCIQILGQIALRPI